MLFKLADAMAMATTVDYLLTGNPAEETPLGSSRIFRRFQAVEGFESDDQETIICLIDGMIAKHKMQSALISLDDYAINH
jgi:hypothetical protein